MKRLVLLAVLVTGLLSAGAATAIATPSGHQSISGSASPSSDAAMGAIKVNYKINKFVKKGNRLIAKGVATATYTPESGSPTTKSKAFSARVVVGKGFMTQSRQEICPVLTLQLDQLSLDLLGLHVDLSKVVLTITANSEGGILGRLFCSVANGKVKLATIQTAQRFTTAARKSGLATKGVGYTIGIRQGSAMAPGPCKLIDLVLGPLHVDLLGLVVDLNQVHLQITADPNEGPLGTLLCSLTNQP